MTDSLKDRIDHMRERRRAWEDRKLSDFAECIDNVSKEIKGEMRRVEYREDTCRKEDCVSTREDWRIDDMYVVSGTCDGQFSRDVIVGNLKATIEAAYRNNSKDRGYHRSDDLEIESPTSDWNLTGGLTGVCNAGTHHPPLRNPSESCDEADHWEGGIELYVENPKDGEVYGEVLAQYAFDIEYLDADRTRAAVLGTIEGVLIRVCEEEPADA